MSDKSHRCSCEKQVFFCSMDLRYVSIHEHGSDVYIYNTGMYKPFLVQSLSLSFETRSALRDRVLVYVT